MPAVFPIRPSIGYGGSLDTRETLRIYDDLTWRAYRRSNAAHDQRNLTFNSISQAQFDSLFAFVKARKQAATGDAAFYYYDNNVVNQIDLTGASTTGRHLARFISELSWTRSGKCRYSASVSILLLD